MKMSKLHYDDLKARVALQVPQIEGHRATLRNNPKVKDLSTRLLWDVFHATRIQNAYSYQEFDYKDAHIETAMRAIFKELNIPL